MGGLDMPLGICILIKHSWYTYGEHFTFSYITCKNKSSRKEGSETCLMGGYQF